MPLEFAANLPAYCQSGSERDALGICQGCPIGEYKDNSEDIFGPCLPCEGSFTTNTVNSTSAAACFVGKVAAEVKETIMFGSFCLFSGLCGWVVL
jgi:hypothetical protein